MLTTDARDDADLDRAIDELLTNATRLALAGFAVEAHAALARLLQSGPWRLPAHGQPVHRLERLLPVVSLLAQQPCAAIGDQPAMDLAGLDAWADARSDDLLHGLAQPSRVQQGAAATDWSDDFLATLVQRRGAPDAPRPHLAFGRFCIDAEFVLKARVQQRFGVSGAADVPSKEELQSLGLPAEELALLLDQVDQVAAAGRIDVAPAADAIPTLAIGRAVIGYLSETGFAGGHLDPVFAPCWLLLVDDGDDAAAAEIGAAWLRQDEGAAARMLDFAVLPSVRRLLLGGAMASALQIDAGAAGEWLEGLAQRPQAGGSTTASPAQEADPEDGSSKADPATQLQGTPLQALHWRIVPVPDSDEQAWVATVPPAGRRALWQAARELVAQTGRWPIVTTSWWGTTDDIDDDRLADEFFMRSPYAQGASRDDLAPRAFIADAQAVELAGFLAGLVEKEQRLNDADQVNMWRYELDRAGIAWASERFDAAWADCAGDRLRLERWLADEEASHGAADPDLGRQPPFDPANAWLVLLPTPRSEDALAYLHWYGLERGRPEGFIRLLRDWRERHGAELWAHYGTMLEFTVERPPQALDGAMALAREHQLAAPCTLQLPGVPLRHHALGLIGWHEWFLHERP